MNRFILHSLIVLLLLGASVNPVRADEDVWSAFVQAENHIRGLINFARANPVQAMIASGIDPAAVMAAYPEDAERLAGGMPPLVDEGRLKVAARAHTLDRLAHNLYGHEGSDGRSYEERIEATGYDATATGESLGMIAFYNYIDPSAAAEAIFRNMLKDELTQESGARRNILDPDLEEVGIGFAAGQVVINGRLYNAYMVTCDFGSNLVENITARGAESTLIILINQARMRPLDVATSLGIDTSALQASDPERYATLAEGMPPVARHDALTTAAGRHARDMAMRGYYSHEDPSGKGYASRIAESGYDPGALVGEILGYTLLPDGAVLSIEIQRLFENVMRSEFAAAPEDRTLLNPAWRDVGLGIEVGALPTEAGLRKALVLTLNWGGSLHSPQIAEGWIYQDRDGNGLYSVGEGVYGVLVNAAGYVRPPGELIPVPMRYAERMTDGAGRFSVPDVARSLDVWIGDERHTIGNIQKEYKDLVFLFPATSR